MAIYNVIKPQGQRLLKPFVKLLGTSDPNFLTWLGLVFSLFAGWFFLMSENRAMLLLVIPFILLRMAFNVLDGMVARQANKTTAYGEALAEFMDRLSDVAIFLGMTFSTYCSAMFGLLGIIVVLIASYVGILGKAVGAQRQFGGIMGKVDRLILVMVFAAAQYLFAGKWAWVPERLKNFDVLMIIIMAGGVVTVIQRWRVIGKILALPSSR
jgi:phosphatidylglycerophosphate synthase